jgi:CRISPR-associated protein Cas8a1/Csx13
MIAKAVKPKIELNLSDSAMTMLHRAGVAGLYLTLKALAKRYPTLNSRQGNFKWVLTNDSISLYWQGSDDEALDWLFSKSFQISDLGLISLLGLDSQTRETQLITHIGMSNTFLQHNSVLKFDGAASQSLIIDGLEIDVSYKKAKYYIHQDYAKKLCDPKGQLLTKHIGIKGWLYPGATVKHQAFTADTQFKETVERVIALLFAPVACLYFILPKSHLHHTKTQYCLVVPEITNLKLYAQQRQKLNCLNHQQFYASGCSDAGLRFLANMIPLTGKNNLKRCQVITFGQTQWSNTQKIRTNVELIEINELIIHIYRLCDRYFNNRVVEWENRKFIATSIIRELITENLARGFPWWYGFSNVVENKDLSKLVSYERKGLQAMVEHADWDLEAHELFIKACHEALSRIYAKLYSQAGEEDFVQIEKENERIRISLIRCQSYKAFRHFMASFLTKAGSNSVYVNHEQKLTPLMTHPKNWELSRDLALLALVSYKTKKQKEREKQSTSALTTHTSSED